MKIRKKTNKFFIKRNPTFAWGKKCDDHSLRQKSFCQNPKRWLKNKCKITSSKIHAYAILGAPPKHRVLEHQQQKHRLLLHRLSKTSTVNNIEYKNIKCLNTLWSLRMLSFHLCDLFGLNIWWKILYCQPNIVEFNPYSVIEIHF
jgi:hypothetical protein